MEIPILGKIPKLLAVFVALTLPRCGLGRQEFGRFGGLHSFNSKRWTDNCDARKQVYVKIDGYSFVSGKHTIDAYKAEPLAVKTPARRGGKS